MNGAHFHLVVNHLPIVGLLIGILILITGLALKKVDIQLTALGVFIFSAVSSIVAFNTGEGAEEMVENLPNVGDQVIHEHEEMAEKLAIALYVLGTFSIAGLVLNMMNHSKAKLVTYVVLLISLAAAFLGKQTGTTGGEVRHTEIRANATTQVGVQQSEGTTEDDD